MSRKKINKFQRRDGQIIDFDQIRITKAIFKALTATKTGGRRQAKNLSEQVVNLTRKRLKNGEIPKQEEIQDTVEEVLILNDLTETAKAFILYREQRRIIREAQQATEKTADMVDQYLDEVDWEVKENANMAYSLQGLNHYVTSAVTKKYWLNKIYPQEIRTATYNGDLHIHNLDCLGAYCCGWDLYDLLLRGFGGVSGKVESKPPKHFQSALGQLVNFFYTLQGESAGAQAVSSFDTLLAPFIRYDKLSFLEVKQSIQEFLFNCAIPTRVGFQCLSEDTEILTLQGWQRYDEVKKGDIIKTLNLKTKEIENKPVASLFKRNYKGSMYRLQNRISDQLISPKHMVVRKKFNSQEYVLEPIEEVAKLKSPFIVPIAGQNNNKEAKISDQQIKLMAWIISEGTIERPTKYRCCYRVSLYQSKIKNEEHYNEIIKLLRHFKLKYSEYAASALGDDVQRIRLNADSSKTIHKWFGTKASVHFIPEPLLKLSQRQSRLFLTTYLKGDGAEGCKIATTDAQLLDDLQIVVVNAGYGFTVLKRKPTIGKKDIFILRLIYHQETYISKVEKVSYEGVIWCPTTENQTVIARRKGKVFITGNCPFTNVTLDINPSPALAKQSVIIGGKSQKETYGEFQEEMNVFNKAFYESMIEGDSKGRPFSFPIPTVNITKDFDWENKVLSPLWEATAKFGLNYFANFIHSDMKPEDVRSMCCRLRLDNKELLKRGGGLFGSNPLTGSIGVVTVNLPRLGYQAKNKKDFFVQLTKMMDIARESLDIKRKALEDLTEKGLYPYSKYYLQGVKKARGHYWSNHFSTIGLVGLNEAALNFIGKDIGSLPGRRFANEVLSFMRERLIKYQKEEDGLYNLEATPAEGTSYRLAKKDKEFYPDIIVANEKAVKKQKAVPFYTNSSQLPVDYTEDLFKALELQDDLQIKYTGGTVLHGFIGERLSDEESVKALIKKVFEKFRLPYFTLTPTFSICPSHGYIAGENFTCPKCVVNQPCEVYSRIVGYLRPIQQWNDGKKQEFSQRKPYKC